MKKLKPRSGGTFVISLNDPIASTGIGIVPTRQPYYRECIADKTLLGELVTHQRRATLTIHPCHHAARHHLAMMSHKANSWLTAMSTYILYSEILLFVSPAPLLVRALCMHPRECQLKNPSQGW